LARWNAKEIVLSIDSTNEAIIFLEAIQKQIKIADIIANYAPGKVTIRFEGAKENIKDAIDMAKNLHQIVSGMLYPDSKDFYNYDLKFLTKITGKTVPLKTLMRILNRQGYEATREEGTINAKIDFKAMKELIILLDKTLGEIPYEVSTSSLRDVIATMIILNDQTSEEAIALAKKKKITKEDDLNRLILAMESEQALEKCLKKAK